MLCIDHSFPHFHGEETVPSTGPIDTASFAAILTDSVLYCCRFPASSSSTGHCQYRCMIIGLLAVRYSVCRFTSISLPGSCSSYPARPSASPVRAVQNAKKGSFSVVHRDGQWAMPSWQPPYCSRGPSTSAEENISSPSYPSNITASGFLIFAKELSSRLCSALIIELAARSGFNELFFISSNETAGFVQSRNMRYYMSLPSGNVYRHSFCVMFWIREACQGKSALS